MPIGYGLLLAFLATATVVALAPRTRLGGRVRYLLSVSLNEVPQVFAVGLVVATAQAWWAGDLAGAGGVVGSVGAVAVLLGLLLVARRSAAARGEVAAGLSAAGVPPARRPRRSHPWLAPLPVRPRSVVRRRGVAYGPHRRQRLDVYRRRDGVADGRVLVYLHGGGYYSGGRHREGRALLHRLAADGWTCVSGGYRLRPGAGFEDHLADARSVLHWAHSHALPQGAEPSAVVMAGSSAGAHLSVLCALDQPPDDAAGRVDGLVCLYGYYGRYYDRGPDERTASTPFALDPAAAPPVLAVHGDRDSWVPVEQARELREHLAPSPATTAYVELTGAQHGFDLFASARYRAVVDGVVAFLDHAVPSSRAT